MASILSSKMHLRMQPVSRVVIGNVRFAGGGGGRPGGKPTFNWKERAALGLKRVKLNAPRDKNYPRNPHLYGDARTIQSYLDEIPPEDQIIVDGPEKASDELIAAFYARIEKIHADSKVKSEPKLSYNLLFGPNKTFGMIPSKKDRPRRRFAGEATNRFRRQSISNN